MKKKRNRPDKIEISPYKDRIYHLYFYENKNPNEISEILFKEYGFKITPRTIYRHFALKRERDLGFRKQILDKFNEVLISKKDVIQRSKEEYFIFLQKHIEILSEVKDQIALLKRMQFYEDSEMTKFLEEVKNKEQFKDIYKILKKAKNSKELKINISGLLKDYFHLKHKIFAYLDKFLKELNLLNLLKELTQKYFEILTEILLEKFSNSEVMEIVDRLGKQVDILITELLNKYAKVTDLSERFKD